MIAGHVLFIIDIYHYHSSFDDYNNKTKEELLFAAVCIFL